MASQTTNMDNSVQLSLSGQLDNSTHIGLQGEDFANLLNAMNNKDLINTQAIMAQNKGLENITKTQAQNSQNLLDKSLTSLNVLGKNLKTILIVAGCAICGLVIFKTILGGNYGKKR